MDPVEPPGAFTRRVIKLAALNSIIEIYTQHNLEIPLITIQYPILDVILTQDLF
jgi:hypothetical protein